MSGFRNCCTGPIIRRGNNFLARPLVASLYIHRGQQVGMGVEEQQGKLTIDHNCDVSLRHESASLSYPRMHLLP